MNIKKKSNTIQAIPSIRKDFDAVKTSHKTYRPASRLALMVFSIGLAASVYAADAEPQPSVAENPCNISDPGFGIYDSWGHNVILGQILMPHRGGLTSKNEFDVIIHFHGSDAIRKTLVPAARGVFVVGVDLGVGSGAYQRAFLSPHVFPELLDSIENAVAEHAHVAHAHIRKLGLSGWSAGYGAIREILRQDASARVDSVALIDGLHADYDETDISGMQTEQLAPFVRFAKRAARGNKFMFVSHSNIVPPGYASTTETAHYLVKTLRGKILRSSGHDGLYLSRYEQAKIGKFLMRGYLGDGKSDHCAEIGVMPGVVATLEKRWKTPRGKGAIPTRAALTP
ncbi:MAG TPA: hypothetical protein VI457_09190 [Methylococcaceae bacterium]|nr:hypothetical protein [Methylococcaceae bacterium]